MTVRRVLCVVLALVACLTIASPAHAYLDPGTGSMLVSALIGVAAAVALALKMFWYRVAGWVRRKRRGVRPERVEGGPATDE